MVIMIITVIMAEKERKKRLASVDHSDVSPNLLPRFRHQIGILLDSSLTLLLDRT